MLTYAPRSRFKSRRKFEAENLVLRKQLNIFIREQPNRLRLRNSYRLLLVCCTVSFLPSWAQFGFSGMRQ